MKEKWNGVFYLFFPLIGGSIVGLIIKNYMDYNTLKQPWLAPKPIIFPIAWSILYVLLGIAYFIYRKQNNSHKVNVLYYLQLVVNFLWSIFFFLLKWRLFSILWILVLIFLVVLLMFHFYREEKISFYLFIPYILWLLFAIYLNIGIYLLN